MLELRHILIENESELRSAKPRYECEWIRTGSVVRVESESGRFSLGSSIASKSSI